MRNETRQTAGGHDLSVDVEIGARGAVFGGGMCMVICCRNFVTCNLLPSATQLESGVE